MNFVQIAIPFFILALLLEFCYGAFKDRQTYRLNDTVNSLYMGLLSRLIGILRLGFSAIVITWCLSLLGIEQWVATEWWHWALAFVAYDFFYYWKHRFGHEWRILWASHVAHHQSEEFNLSTALRQTSTDYIGFLFYLPMYLVGTPVEVMVSVGSLNLVYQFWVHTEHVRRLGWLDFILVTPSNHRVHHSINADYLDKNYGGVFIIWDRLFGTFAVESEADPCRYGITKQLGSWNPLWANLHVWWDTLRLSLSARGIQKVLIWFKGPAWIPSNDNYLHEGIENGKKHAKFDPVVSRFDGGYCFFQLWLITGAGLMLLENQNVLPREIVVIFFWILLATMIVHGFILQAERWAKAAEVVRLILLPFLVVLLGEASPEFSKGTSFLLMPLSCYVVLSLGAMTVDHLLVLRRSRVGSIKVG